MSISYFARWFLLARSPDRSDCLFFRAVGLWWWRLSRPPGTARKIRNARVERILPILVIAGVEYVSVLVMIFNRRVAVVSTVADNVVRLQNTNKFISLITSSTTTP